MLERQRHPLARLRFNSAFANGEGLLRRTSATEMLSSLCVQIAWPKIRVAHLRIEVAKVEAQSSRSPESLLGPPRR